MKKQCSLYIFFFLWVWLYIFEGNCFDIFKVKNLKIDRMEKCQHMKNATLYISDIRMIMIKRISYISANIINEKLTSNDIRLEMKLTRCKNKEQADSCENYQRLKLNKMCDMLVGKGQPWSPFLQKIEPRVVCPIKKGVYVVNNGSFDGTLFARMPFLNEGWYWKIEAQGYDAVLKEIVMCVYVEAQIQTV